MKGHYGALIKDHAPHRFEKKRLGYIEILIVTPVLNLYDAPGNRCMDCRLYAGIIASICADSERIII
ncbi:MAG: hypothetical protein A4E50_01188 [Methanosaeta sp. PtaB.Bin087]|jgi:hypothetical protein|nr:MAG: hypothetical protein A4E50_01188 [Methanosaeta sp. PtaB.Bin087]